jgi:hypothetical protein
MADGCGRISEFSKVHRQRAHENQRIGMTLQLATAAHCFASTPTPFVSPYCSANCGTLLCPNTSIPHTAQMFFLWLKLLFFAQMFSLCSNVLPRQCSRHSIRLHLLGSVPHAAQMVFLWLKLLFFGTSSVPQYLRKLETEAQTNSEISRHLPGSFRR